MPGQRHSQPNLTFVGSRVYVCLDVTCRLHCRQNDRGLLRATAVTRGWNGHQIRVSTQSSLRRRKFSRRFCRDSNSQPFDHESGAVPTTSCPGSHKARISGSRRRMQIYILTKPRLIIKLRRTFDSSGFFSREDLNFCVRGTRPWGVTSAIVLMK